MIRHKAFSLRDLVVLLCLVAVALPVLAASLGGAINLSAAERCRATLASLTRCIQVYVQQNRGYLPVYRHSYREAGGLRYIEAPAQPAYSAVAFSSGMGRNPMTGLYVDVRGLGYLYVQGLARPPELFYCPAPIQDTRHMLVNYPKPWGSHTGPGSAFIRIGYMFDPWVKQIPGGSSDQVTYEDALILRRHPANWPLLCDLVWSRDTTGHVQGNSALWNMAYPDGHVAPKTDQELFDQFAAGLNVGADWTSWNQYVRPKLLPPAGP
jgi:hypothetical protein